MLERYLDKPLSLTASQSSIVTDAGGSFQDITGCSLSLLPGTWIIMANGCPRVWQNGTTYTNAQFQMRVCDSSASTVYALTQAHANVEGEQAGPTSLSLCFYLVLSVTTTIKIQGLHSIITGGANFASGWRWDSGFGQPATLFATRVAGRQ